MEVRTGALVKNYGIFLTWAEPDPKTAFFAFLGYPSTILCTVYRKQFYPKSMIAYRRKAETLKVCLLLV